MANTQPKRRQRGSIRSNGAGFQVRVYAGRDPLTKKELYLHEQATTWDAVEKARTRLLAKVDEQRHPKGKITVGKVIDQWMEVTRIEESTRDRYVIAIDQYMKPTLGQLQAAKLDPQLIELFYARLFRCREQCEGKLDGRTEPRTGCRHECKPLSNGSLRELHYILKPALERAVPSTSSSPGRPRTGTGPWSRCGSRREPGRAPRGVLARCRLRPATGDGRSQGKPFFPAAPP
ncbi:hypothetical protein [Streptomyces sp. 7N604]|uniref:hypothetical protein n=1 Tax=Streptomyces sp. 7N604 TaxID=3457415 RepID=UPI003FD421B6